jgi:AcrR family transcriptional regulator
MSEEDPRRRTPRRSSREAILAAALDEFGEKSFAEGTTAGVAERAGVSKGLVFNYFPSKEALLQALVEKMLSETLDFWDGRAWQGPPREQLADWVDTAIAQVLRRPGFYRLYFSLAVQPGGSAAVDRALSALKPRLERYLARAEKLLEAVGSPDPALDARLLQCAINGLAQAIVAGPGFAREEDVLAVGPLRARLADIFWRGGAGGEAG